MLLVDFHRMLLTHALLALSADQFFNARKKTYEHVHSVRIELAKLILVGTKMTYQATGDAGNLHYCMCMYISCSCVLRTYSCSCVHTMVRQFSVCFKKKIIYIVVPPYPIPARWGMYAMYSTRQHLRIWQLRMSDWDLRKFKN